MSGALAAGRSSRRQLASSRVERGPLEVECHEALPIGRRAPRLRILGGVLALAFVAGMAPVAASSDSPSSSGSSSSATPSQQSTDEARTVLVPQSGTKADVAPVVDIIAPKVKVGVDSDAKGEGDGLAARSLLLAAWTSSLIRPVN